MPRYRRSLTRINDMRRMGVTVAAPASSSTPTRAPQKNAPDDPGAASEQSYRDLQAQAKALDIPANQSREELEAAIKGQGG